MSYAPVVPGVFGQVIAAITDTDEGNETLSPASGRPAGNEALDRRRWFSRSAGQQ
jgi:hypothetical protein